MLLFPVIEAYFLVLNLAWALISAGKVFVGTLVEMFDDDRRFWYREVYRPARYGSVYDK